MRRMPWAVYLWPGLPQIWLGGSWFALAGAVAAAAALNAALLSTFVWNELLSAGARNASWGVLGAAWLAAAGASAFAVRRPGAATEARSQATFEEALDQYLKANWFECERALRTLLEINAGDLDARLLLATLMRHTRRCDEAAAQLDQFARFDGVEKWNWEIHRERELLAAAREAASRTAMEASTALPTPEAAESVLQAA